MSELPERELSASLFLYIAWVSTSNNSLRQTCSGWGPPSPSFFSSAPSSPPLAGQEGGAPLTKSALPPTLTALSQDSQTMAAWDKDKLEEELLHQAILLLHHHLRQISELKRQLQHHQSSQVTLSHQQIKSCHWVLPWKNWFCSPSHCKICFWRYWRPSFSLQCGLAALSQGNWGGASTNQWRLSVCLERSFTWKKSSTNASPCNRISNIACYSFQPFRNFQFRSQEERLAWILPSLGGEYFSQCWLLSRESNLLWMGPAGEGCKHLNLHQLKNRQGYHFPFLVQMLLQQ